MTRRRDGWFLRAGFASQDDAEAAGCSVDNSWQFRAGALISHQVPVAELSEPARPFEVVPVFDLDEGEPPPAEYAWLGRIPIGHVTTLNAHGGGGKSTVAQMLQVATAADKPLFGIPTRPCKSVFFSAEDGAALLRRRLHFICRAMSVAIADIVDSVFILDATAGDPVLYAEVATGGRREGMTTPTFTALREFISAYSIELLIIDNSSDVFDASEIDRARVRGFMRALSALAQELNLAVLLLAHVDKGTSRGERSGTEGYSGSTAWHNSARSRLFMSRDAEGGLLIEQQKHNLGPLSEPLRLAWPKGGIPQADVQVGPVVQGISDRVNEKAILKLIAEFSRRGEYVGTATTSRAHAGKLLRKEPTFPRVKDAEVFDILRQAERSGHIERLTVRGANRHEKECWRVTPSGAAFAGIPALTALTALTSHPDALRAPGAEAAPTALTSALGGVGERARAFSAAGG